MHLIHDPRVPSSDKGIQTAFAEASKRGLASASEETRERVARAGGNAPHEMRGLQAAPQEVRTTVAVKGGLARGEQRRRLRKKEEVTPSQTTIIDER